LGKFLRKEAPQGRVFELWGEGHSPGFVHDHLPLFFRPLP
jgi:hypothetical protein